MRFNTWRIDAYRLYLIMGATSSFAASMIFTVLAVYYVQTVGMNPLQLVLVGTVLEATILLFEVPTGIVADAYSRRLSVIIGFVLIGVCYLIQGNVPIFAIIIAAEILRGVGETFLSGAQSAWIADEIGEEKVGRAYLRYGQVSRIGGFAGIGLGTALAIIHLPLPIYLGGALQIVLALFLLFTMPEQGFTPAPRTVGDPPWRAMGRIFQDGLTVMRGKPVVMMLVLVGIVFGAFSEGFDRLWEAQFLTTFTFPTQPALAPVVWIGLLNAGSMILGIGVAEVLVRRWEVHGARNLGPLLLSTSTGLIVAVVLFGLAPNFGVAVAAFWIAGMLRSLQYPVATTWINQHVPSRVRATVLSLMGQADALGQVGGGPIVGVVGLRSLRAALVFAGLILTPALVLYSRGERLEAESQAVAAGPEI